MKMTDDFYIAADKTDIDKKEVDDIFSNLGQPRKELIWAFKSPGLTFDDAVAVDTWLKKNAYGYHWTNLMTSLATDLVEGGGWIKPVDLTVILTSSEVAMKFRFDFPFFLIKSLNTSDEKTLIQIIGRVSNLPIANIGELLNKIEE